MKKVAEKDFLFKLYSLKDYRKSQDFIDNGFEEIKLSVLKKKLMKENGYHFRINKDGTYIFFGDCDGFRGTFEEFFVIIKLFLDKYYDIQVELDDVSYTTNESKEGSFHYSIPKIYCSCEKLKEIHGNMLECYKNKFVYDGKNVKVIDVGIYTDKWFRYPNQLKENKKGTEHVIKKGTMVDFITEYIPISSVCIEDKKYLLDSKKEKKQIVKNIDVVEKSIILDEDIDSKQYDELTILDVDDCKKILSLLNKDRIDDYDEWIKIGQILKNHSKKKITHYSKSGKNGVKKI